MSGGVKGADLSFRFFYSERVWPRKRKIKRAYKNGSKTKKRH
jgi:hypothetical protein